MTDSGTTTNEAWAKVSAREWWIYFDLAQPRDVGEIATRAEIGEAMVRMHVRSLTQVGLLKSFPSSQTDVPRYFRVETLSSAQLEEARSKVRSAGLEIPPGAVRLLSARRSSPSAPGPTSLSGASTDAGERSKVKVLVGGVAAAAVAVVSLALLATTAGSTEREPDSIAASPASASDSSPAPDLSSDTPPEPKRKRKRPAATSPQPDPVEQVDQVPQIDEDQVADQAFLAQIQAGDYPYFSTLAEDLVINLGRSLCVDLADGYDPYELAFQIATQSGTDDPVEGAAVVGAAMGAYCPEYAGNW